jgi:uncharacterized protein
VRRFPFYDLASVCSKAGEPTTHDAERTMKDRTTMASPTGVGLGLRWEFISELCASRPDLPFLEISPENYIGRGGRFRALLGETLETYPLLSHGLSLSLGGADPFDPTFLRNLRSFLDEIRAPFHSDHLCFSSVSGNVLHDLLPIPFHTTEVSRIADRIKLVSDAIGRPVAVENVSYYLHPGAAEMGEAEFVARVCEAADCKLMLDVNNAYVNAQNFGHDVREWLRTVPLDRVVQMHVAGHDYFDESSFELSDVQVAGKGRLIVDTHGADVCNAVYELVEEVIEKTGPVPVVLERDQSIPELRVLLDEVARLTIVYERGLTRHEKTTDSLPRVAGVAGGAR